MRVRAVISPPILLFHSFHVNPRGSSRRNYRLHVGILDFACGGASDCILNPYSTENFRVALANGHFITVILLEARITYGTVDTMFRGDWIVIDCGIIPEM